jgi:cytoskeletal protein CcmA (bactofilin family)
MPSIILRDTTLQGNIHQKDSITIDGIVVGDITADEIIVHMTADIKGNLMAAHNLETAGKVTGNLSSEKIHINNTAKIKGQIKTLNLKVDEGAQLEIQAFTNTNKKNVL